MKNLISILVVFLCVVVLFFENRALKKEVTQLRDSLEVQRLTFEGYKIQSEINCNYRVIKINDKHIKQLEEMNRKIKLICGQ